MYHTPHSGSDQYCPTSEVLFNTVQPTEVQVSIVQPIEVLCNTVQPSEVLSGTVQPTEVHTSTVQLAIRLGSILCLADCARDHTSPGGIC